MATDDENNSHPSASFMPERHRSDGNFGDEKWREIAKRVAGLLAHYWTAADDRAIRRVQIADWVEDLKEFPLGAIEGACITWRRTSFRKPTPADIRKLILPDAGPAVDLGAAYNPYTKSLLTEFERTKHRNAIASLWDLVMRSRNGEDPDMLVAERKRLSEEMFSCDPDLRRINELIEQEKEQEKQELARKLGRPVPKECPLPPTQQEYREQQPWKDKVAAAYRWLHMHNCTMPVGVSEHASSVKEAVRCWITHEEPSQLLRDYVAESRKVKS